MNPIFMRVFIDSSKDILKKYVSIYKYGTKVEVGPWMKKTKSGLPWNEAPILK